MAIIVKQLIITLNRVCLPVPLALNALLLNFEIVGTNNIFVQNYENRETIRWYTCYKSIAEFQEV